MATKRLVAPQSTYPWSDFVPKKYFKKRAPLIDQSTGKRENGRSCNEFRPTFMKTGVVYGATGSSYMEIGSTKVICSIHGPREPTRKSDYQQEGRLVCDLKMATFSEPSRQSPIHTPAEKLYSSVIEQALTEALIAKEFQKAQIELYVIIIQNGGSALATAINACVLALCDAGIEMRDFPCATSVSVVGESYLIDPSVFEEYNTYTTSGISTNDSECKGTLTVCYLPNYDLVTTLKEDGPLLVPTVLGALAAGIEGALRMKEAMKQCLAKNSIHS